MTPQQVVLKNLQRLLPKIQDTADLLIEIEELIQMSIDIESVEPIDSILAEEYQTLTDKTKKAEELAENLARLENLYKDNDSIYTRPN